MLSRTRLLCLTHVKRHPGARDIAVCCRCPFFLFFFFLLWAIMLFFLVLLFIMRYFAYMFPNWSVESASSALALREGAV